ncbi:MAG: DegT/DnrJ/EryC1/StrS family aminotransferase, partial [Bdellovibrionales bacterium]
LYPLRINQCTEMQRDEIITSISSLGVSVNVHFIPVPMMSFYKKLGFKIDDYPVTKSNYEVEISLPVFFDLNEAQIQEVIAAVVESVNKVLA